MATSLAKEAVEICESSTFTSSWSTADSGYVSLGPSARNPVGNRQGAHERERTSAGYQGREKQTVLPPEGRDTFPAGTHRESDGRWARAFPALARNKRSHHGTETMEEYRGRLYVEERQLAQDKDSIAWDQQSWPSKVMGYNECRGPGPPTPPSRCESRGEANRSESPRATPRHPNNAIDSSHPDPSSTRHTEVSLAPPRLPSSDPCEITPLASNADTQSSSLRSPVYRGSGFWITRLEERLGSVAVSMSYLENDEGVDDVDDHEWPDGVCDASSTTESDMDSEGLELLSRQSSLSATTDTSKDPSDTSGSQGNSNHNTSEGSARDSLSSSQGSSKRRRTDDESGDTPSNGDRGKKARKTPNSENSGYPSPASGSSKKQIPCIVKTCEGKDHSISELV